MNCGSYFLHWKS